MCNIQESYTSQVKPDGVKKYIQVLEYIVQNWLVDFQVVYSL